MKIRTNFVSNSSTSSFVCLICGNQEAGSDCASAHDYGFTHCENGHCMCEDHVNEKDKDNEPTIAEMKEKLIELEYSKKEDLEEMDNYDIEASYEDMMLENDDDELTEDKCPICQFKNLVLQHAAVYLMDKYNISEKNLLAELKGKYKTYDEFEKLLKF